MITAKEIKEKTKKYKAIHEKTAFDVIQAKIDNAAAQGHSYVRVVSTYPNVVTKLRQAGFIVKQNEVTAEISWN